MFRPLRGAKRELKIEKPVVDFHNPYFDPTIKTFHSRGHRKLKFSKQGKYVQQADQVRTKLKLAELQKKINDKAKDIGLEKQISISDEVFIVETVPQAEWWDLQFLPSHSYDDLDSSNISYELVGNLVHHPVQVKVHNEDTSERKKLRRQRRAEIHEEKQEKIRLGLLPPEQSKLKLSNMMQVLTKEAVQDPTKVEAMVRAQMEQRKSKHEQQNAQRKLTDEQRREKTLQKLQKDSDKQVLMAVFNLFTFQFSAMSDIDKLDYYYHCINDIILKRQNACTGLIPASTAVNNHGDYRDAWVRDNVYSILAVFGLAIAYKRLDDDSGRAFQLEHSVVKTMRGLLFAMMRQSNKVELFKNTQSPANSLHAKYSTSSGDTVGSCMGSFTVGRNFYLHSYSRTAAGFQIIFTLDEVDFIQNLVYYIERTYRTPDYGIWERGNKMNHGLPELNSSSIGMAVAALQAINGINLFGADGGPNSVVHSLPDEIARNYTTLISCLPREALLSVIGYPAFAVDNPDYQRITREEIEKKLLGRYGCRRFLRDGHQTVLEDKTRLHYDPHELKIFESIECEWPLFFTYLILDAIFLGRKSDVEKYSQMLDKVLVVDKESGRKLVPELYIVSSDDVEAEKREPHSQNRHPNENVPLVWAHELDPLGRYKLINRQKNDVLIQIVLISENESLQAKLATYGVETQTLKDTNPFHVAHPSVLRDSYTALGYNEKLGLTGRPNRPIGSLGTCKVYRFRGKLYFFTPHFMDMEEFYLTMDNNYLVSVFEHELQFIRKNWKSPGRPTTTLRTGKCNDVRVRLGALHEMINTACIESLDFLQEKMSANQIDKLFKPFKIDDVNKRGFLLNHDYGKIKKRTVCLPKSPNGKKIELEENNTNCFELSAPSFKLKDHNFEAPRRTMSPGISKKRRDTLKSSDSRSCLVQLSINTDEILKPFILKDESRLGEALEVLKETEDIYEQMDLLYYIHSCKGIDFECECGNVGVLLEEIYFKASSLNLWSIVRHAASLLEKVVNSLSINLTDLLIQHKHVSIGYGPEEKFVSEPIPPALIKKLIYSSVHDDIREATLIQEILTHLGSFIRAEPKLFEGILRVRTKYIVLALRDDIMRQKNLDEIEASETLMAMSPSDIKTSLGRLLSLKQETIESSKEICNIIKFEDEWFGDVKDVLHLAVQSGGFEDGNFSRFSINKEIKEASERGMILFFIDPYDGSVNHRAAFDTHINDDESSEMIKAIQIANDEEFILISVRDDASGKLGEKAKDLLSTLGSKHIRQLGYRDSWCMITRKSNKNDFFVEAYNKRGEGPTDIISLAIPLKRSITAIAFGPSKGRWFQKRKVEGALNKVPIKFYPKVWSILENCGGITLSNKTLPRDPTVSEKTPEEYNFALQVESFLDGYFDPAERQLAVEALMIISRIQERNPEIVMRENIIDIDKMIKEGIKLLWTVLKQSNSFMKIMPTLNNFPESSEYPEALIKRIFYDLPQQGTESTTSFLTQSILQTMPYRIDSTPGCSTQ
ncbi:phosphorylase kinase alphabeta [Rozella allomycis CSF55]|uniref:Glycoside hydrolase family 15 domain-containing protein n=1 Tax=Rozella allomycis (strain CSF55) TaxID=988480 RepID=A0A075APG0_ROZAC|nr:Glycoside hydrolase family 15 domain-containing protein [Rozella allomycis CSF55]RKP22012.1 phosphorylase kinase alphabeta [Rozella allomycis CSF55]|eukprot:EPZ31984.1 Glycoside hydrolase family 15 domain-containing protein [Rozella allomycis CSF55]